MPTLNNGGKTCRISNKAIYRALGVENIRHRRTASDLVVMRRLLVAGILCWNMRV